MTIAHCYKIEYEWNNNIVVVVVAAAAAAAVMKFMQYFR